MSMRERFFASVDPPAAATCDGATLCGGSSERAPDAFATDGGVSGFITDPAWALVLGEGAEAEEQLGDLRHLQHLLQSYPESEGAMQLQCLNQLRAALNTVGLDQDADTPVEVPAWVLVLAARKLARALR